MIVEMNEKEFEIEFFEEFAYLECGNHFKSNNQQHVNWVKKRMISHKSNGGKFFVSLNEEQDPIGFIVLMMDKGLEGDNCFGHYTHIFDFMIREKYQRQGYGKDLLTFAENKSIEMGAYCIYVATYAGNDTSMTYYIKNGFVPVSMLPDIYGPNDQGDVYLRKIFKTKNG